MHRFLLAAAGIFLLTVPVAAQEEAGAKLPPGEHREVVMKVCTKCHDPSIAAEQAFDEKGWKDLVDQMGSNGARGTEEEFAQIVTYLSKAFPAK